MKDDNGIEINIGDRLVCKDGYEVIVYADENLELVGKLVCEPTHSCADIPYCLNNGNGYVHYEYDNKNASALDQYNTFTDVIRGFVETYNAVLRTVSTVKSERAEYVYEWVKQHHSSWLKNSVISHDIRNGNCVNFAKGIDLTLYKKDGIAVISVLVRNPATEEIIKEGYEGGDENYWCSHKIKIEEFK